MTTDSNAVVITGELAVTLEKAISAILAGRPEIEDWANLKALHNALYGAVRPPPRSRSTTTSKRKEPKK